MSRIRSVFFRYWYLWAGLLLAYWWCLPKPLFDRPVSLVLIDRSGRLIGARIADDEQWRFPVSDSLPQKYKTALLTFEDKRFYAHPGIDLRAIIRAARQNLRAGKIVSGGSTISMQLVRLAGDNPPRTVLRKLWECILATRLELTYSKEEILRLYAGHAPFGGNVVGLEAACWRYLGKQPHLMSWAEAAMMAVLPNSPGLIHPGRNREDLLRKRNRLLERLLQDGRMDSLSWQLARQEPLPDRYFELPRLAPHLLQFAELTAGDGDFRIRSSIDGRLQERMLGLAERHHRLLRHNHIYNLAALVIDIERNEVLAYVGNAPDCGAEHGEQVDIIQARRSTGSILKPFLFAAAIEEGHIAPESLLRDIPTQIDGYQPENFKLEYHGLIPARKALIRSLNVPMVRLLRSHGLEKFHHLLGRLQLSTIDRPPSHYGLTLILGGAEGSLWEITSAYAGMARTLLHFARYNGRYASTEFDHPHIQLTKPEGDAAPELLEESPVLSAASIWQTFEAMQELERPDSEGEWQRFLSSRQIAWKTGTSYGFRDAWAVGLTSRYAVGVWVGNADGEGRPGLIGAQTAAPLLFDIFDLLPRSRWFEPPLDEMIRLTLCMQTGYRSGPYCEADTSWNAPRSPRIAACPYHRPLHLDPTGKWRVNDDCMSPSDMQTSPWLVLSPVEAHYYRRRNPDFREIPPLHPDCRKQTSPEDHPDMQLIYPPRPTRIFIPKDLGGVSSRVVFRLAHRDPGQVVHWHLDERYLGSTRHLHSFELQPKPGLHKLILIDERGNRLEQAFEVIGEKR
ncbi:MAG: penicillin-binding protein 1C [Saprospiraceae bacterium]|nr:penicillin-binding protein 1C [Saprospiraceae bacterium]